MRKIQHLTDLAIQSALIGWGVFVVVTAPWPMHVAGLLFVQLLLGGYQMSASLCSIALMRPRSRGKKIHFTSSIIYLFSLAVLSLLHPEKNVMRLYLILPSWILGIYYYWLSLNIRLGSNKRSKFLPHLGF